MVVFNHQQLAFQLKPRIALNGAIAATILLLLSACSGLQTRPPGTEDFTNNGDLHYWSLRGKIGIRDDHSATSAYLNWQQCGDYYNIRLSGPLGQGAAHLYGDKTRVTLQSSDNRPITASTPEQLLVQQLGWEIPVSRLLYWIRGIPDPNLSYTPDDQGFQQSGWQLSYPKRMSIDQYTLPSKAIAKHPQLKLTLILKHWNLQPNCSSLPPSLSSYKSTSPL
ncbi:MAG: lipoprotein insertase outer membrane protein LolB [Pseudomonadales bacterium]